MKMQLIVMVPYSAVLLALCVSGLGLEPQFDVPIANVTVVAGQTAVLPCSITNLHKYKVTWVDSQFISLSYEDRRVVDDSRFSISRPFINDWNLQINSVRWEDQGQYRCTVNTNPVTSKVVMLHVKVPAQILDDLSSEDTTVEEGDTVWLVCNVTGVPRPEVTWYRRPAMGTHMDKERIGTRGEMVVIQNVSRYCDDIYECVADNGVPPSVSRQMRVTVQFAPEIRMRNNRIAQSKGKETILECAITAFPHAVNYWEKDGKRIMSSTKFRIEAYDEGDKTVTLSLRIQNVQAEDFGEYKCVAANLLGRDEGKMYLVEYIEPPPVTTTLRIPVGRPVTYLPPFIKVTPKDSKIIIPGQPRGANEVNSNKNAPASSHVMGNSQPRTSFSLLCLLLAVCWYSTHYVIVNHR